MKGKLLCTLLLCMAPWGIPAHRLVATEATDTSLLFRLYTNQKTYSLYEPVMLRYVIENPTEKDVVIPFSKLMIASGSVRLFIRDSSGRETSYLPLVEGSTIRQRFLLHPHARIVSSEIVSWTYGGRDEFTFPSPGEYELTASALVGYHRPPGGGIFLPSKPVKIEVRGEGDESLGTPEDVAEILGNQLYVKRKTTVIRSGHPDEVERLMLRSSVSNVRKRQEEFLVDHPHHPLAPYVRYALARSLTFASPRDPVRGAQLFLEFQKNNKNSWLADRALWQAAEAFARQYNQKEAEKILDQLKETYPDSDILETAESFRQQLRNGDFVASNVREEEQDRKAREQEREKRP
jgi:hypothetical protein